MAIVRPRWCHSSGDYRPYPILGWGGICTRIRVLFKPCCMTLNFMAILGWGAILKAYGFAACIPSIFWDVEAVICVPSHWMRQLWRGRPHIPFLFSEVLHQVNYRPRAIRAKRYSRPSVGLSRHQRLTAKRYDRFRWIGPVPQSVTVIDDVCTTGATLSDVARCLKAAGVRDIYALTLGHQSLEKEGDAVY